MKGVLVRIRLVILAAVILILGLTTLDLHAGEPAPTGLSVSISFTPSSADPDAYTCKAEISDLETGGILAKQEILGVKGETAKSRIGNDDSNVALEVMVNKAGTTATFTVTQTKAGKVLNVQKGSISLR